MTGTAPFQNPAYRNTDLSEDYRRALYGIDLAYNVKMRILNVANAVREAQVDVVQLFREHGTLKGLKLKGVGAKAREDLEKILRGESDQIKKPRERESEGFVENEGEKSERRYGVRPMRWAPEGEMIPPEEREY